jgi:hypothetical protein
LISGGMAQHQPGVNRQLEAAPVQDEVLELVQRKRGIGLGLVFEVNQEGGRTTSIPGPYEKIARPPATRRRYAVLVDELDSGEIDVTGGIRQK